MTTLQGETGARYRLGEPVAVGGQGTIYEAIDVADGKPVIVKVARATGSDGDNVRLAALRLAALGEDPRVGRFLVPVWDTGTWGDRHFAVLERMERTLETRLQEPRDPLPVLRALIDAVAALERAGVVHGDLKPSNVFVLGDDEAVLLGDLWSGARETLGSPGFSSPETWAGAQPSLAADAYALGATLWAAYAGAPPACAAGPGGARPSRAEIEASGLPAGWRRPVAELLAPDPATRLRASAFADRQESGGSAGFVAFAGLLIGFATALTAWHGAGTPCPAGMSRDGMVCATADGRRVAWVPAGRYTAGDPDRTWAPDAPVHDVALSRAVWFRTTEVTQGEYQALIGANPVASASEVLPDSTLHPCANWEGHDLVHANFPVACVTWFDAIRAANAASERDGLTLAYREAGEGVQSTSTRRWCRWRSSGTAWRSPPTPGSTSSTCEPGRGQAPGGLAR